jgi:hypothetical protein
VWQQYKDPGGGYKPFDADTPERIRLFRQMHIGNRIPNWRTTVLFQKYCRVWSGHFSFVQTEAGPGGRQRLKEGAVQDITAGDAKNIGEAFEPYKQIATRQEREVLHTAATSPKKTSRPTPPSRTAASSGTAAAPKKPAWGSPKKKQRSPLQARIAGGREALLAKEMRARGGAVRSQRAQATADAQHLLQVQMGHAAEIDKLKRQISDLKTMHTPLSVKVLGATPRLQGCIRYV